MRNTAYSVIYCCCSCSGAGTVCFNRGSS